MKKTFTERLKKRRISFISMGVTILCLMLIFTISGRLFGGQSTILFSDLYGQHIPFIKAFWRSLVNGDNPFYSFSLGLGTPSLGPFVWSGALFPLNFLFLIFSEETAAVIIIFFKISLGAFLFAELLRNMWGKKDYTVLLFSCCYALCGYSIVFYPNIQFADGLYMLPLIVLLGDRLLKSGKWMGLTIAYAYIFCLHFYEGFVVGIISFIFFTMNALLNGQERRGRKIVQYVVSVIIAALISAAILIPMCWQIIAGQVEDATKQGKVSLHVLDFFGNLFIGETQQMEDLHPIIYCGVLSLLLLPLYYQSKEVSNKEKISVSVVLGILMLGCFTTWGYSALHMFDAPDGWQFRFSYGVSFLLCLMGARVFSEIEKQKKIYVYIYGLVWIAILFLVQKRQNSMVESMDTGAVLLCLLANAIFIILYCLLLTLKKKKYKGAFITVLVIVELIINGALCVNQNVIPPYENREFGEQYQQEVEQALESVDTENFRVVSNGYFNDPAHFGYMGFATFSTLENGAARNFLKRVGYAVSVRNWQDAGGTDTMKMILAGKNEIVLSADGKVTNVMERRALPLAFMTSSEMNEFSFQGYNAVDNINNLASAMTGESFLPLVSYDGEVRKEMYNVGIMAFEILEKMPYSNMLVVNPGYYELVYRESSGAEALANYYVPVNGYAKAYAFFELDHSVTDYSDPMIVSRQDEMPFSFAAAHVSRMIPLLRQNDEYIVSVYFPKESNDFVVYDKAVFAYEDENCVKAIYDRLSEQAATSFSRNGSRIEFDINATEDMPIMFTSIPYDTGWKVYVDGKLTEINSLVEGAFIGLQLEPGEHHIKMIYEPFVNMMGGIISLSGIVIFLGIYFIQKNKEKKKDCN